MESGPADRWRRIEELIDAALDLPPDERDAWLRAECGDDEELLREVASLIEAGERADGFLEGAAAERAAHLVALDPADAGDPASVAATPQRVGPFRLVREIGRGGMGTVHLAEREAHFRQRVALKLIRPGLHLDRHLIARFVEERQLLADLDHPGIARLLDGGVTEHGLPWFAMEFVEGEPIDRACDARQLSIEARLEIFGAACDAVEYAHQHRVVHRDLKPTNILVSATGSVKLLDFGIAKLLATGRIDADLTGAGLRFLTPDYASPEQLRGDPISPASDVYSLGVLLYELLTGRRPHRLSHLTPGEAERTVLERDPDAPSTVVAGASSGPARDGSPVDSITERARRRGTTAGRLRELLQGDLDAIVMKALSRDPARRYDSAAALASDVRRLLEGLPPATKPRRSGRRRRARLIGGAVVVVGAIATAISVARHPPRRPGAGSTPVLAVGRVTDHRDAAASANGSLADLLATNLARVPGLRVVSTARLYELLGSGSTEADAGAYTTAARRAGASTLIDGDVYETPDGGLRLDLRNIDLATGDIRGALTVRGADLFALADSGTALLARENGRATPDASIADVTTRSEVAYRFYEEGLRRYYRGDVTGARALFDAAIADDSSFAMAYYYRSLAEARPGGGVAILQHALRLADRASDRERLIIRAAWELATADPSLLATAETLTVRYPQEPAGEQIYATALAESGEYAEAIRRFRHVIAVDSIAGMPSERRCAACEARDQIIAAYQALDSIPAAVREARRWTELDPSSANAWDQLGRMLVVSGRAEEGRAAYLRGAELDPSRRGTPEYYAAFFLVPGDFATADAALRQIRRSGTPLLRTDAAWYLAISLRRQGRFEEALPLARQFRRESERVLPPGFGSQAALEAQVLFELGRYREAAALFDSLASEPSLAYASPSRDARYRAWNLTLSANPLVAAGDTIALARLVDSVRAIGERSLLARDHRLHHHVRGLLLAARGDDRGAAEEFRQAVFSMSIGYTRTNYEWARALLRLGRAREAVEVLRPALAFSLEGSGLYVTRTELEELMARAWDSAGAPDSALAHYRAVITAWQRPDQTLLPRVAAVRARVAKLQAAR